MDPFRNIARTLGVDSGHGSANADSRGVSAPQLAVYLTGLALFSSGAAGLVNEVVWQRALKRFLGGSETISSMVVVFVFMLGLGVGSILMGRRAGRIKGPLQALAGIEVLLAVTNTLVCLFLRSDLIDTAVQGQLV